MSIQNLGQIDERSTKEFKFTLVDDVTGLVIPLADISTATLTLYDNETRDAGGSPATGVINSRSAQNVKNANNVTIDATSGLVKWTVQDADFAIINNRRQVEIHRANFRFELTNGAVVNRTYQFEVKNLRTVV